MRTSVIGFYPDLISAFKSATTICLITHYDVNCILGCLIIVGIINQLIYTDLDVHTIITNVIKSATQFVSRLMDGEFDIGFVQDHDNTIDLSRFMHYASFMNFPPIGSKLVVRSDPSLFTISRIT